MAGLSVPNDASNPPVWVKFFDAIVRKFNNGAAVETVATADATDLATAIALVNDLKATVNELIEAQQA